jgi:hypothetical protein
MQSERKIFPGILLLILSMLGFLISLTTGGFVLAELLFFDGSIPAVERLSLVSTASLAAFSALLHIPAFIFTLRDLRQKDPATRQNSLFKPASKGMLLWLGVMAAGFFLSRDGSANLWLAPLTILGITLPVWWLVELARWGLPRSTGLREWGSLSMGLSISPFLIILIEIILFVAVGLFVFLVLSSQPGLLEDLAGIFQDLDFSQNDIESLEEIVFRLAQNPLLASALLLVAGVVAPLVEELLKPMAIWFLLRHRLKPHEGFSLGLISGGAFTLLESAGLIRQIDPVDWLIAVGLRTATGVLHIGLSGFVGYSLARAWNEKQYGRALLSLLIATGLHGAWNGLALVNGYATSLLPALQQSPLAGAAPALTSALMIVIFISVILITISTGRKLRPQDRTETPENLNQTVNQGVIKDG